MSLEFKTWSRPKMMFMARDFTASLLEWSASGFKVVSPSQYNVRLDLCKACEFWDGKAFMETGRCMKCGCSTRAKLSLATSTCPIGKWGKEIYAEPTTNTKSNGNDNNNTPATGRSPDFSGENRAEGVRDGQVS